MASIFTFIGALDVEMRGDLVVVYGVPQQLFHKDLEDEFGTSKIFKLYEISFSWNRQVMQFHKFFLPEFIYILDSLPQRKTYKKLKSILYEKTWLQSVVAKHKPRLDYSRLSDFSTALKPHQREFLETYDQNKQKYHLNGYLNGSGTGSGKTISSMALMHCLKKDAIIVIAPNNTIHASWVQEIRKHFKKQEGIWTKEKHDTDPRWFLVNYEAMDKIMELIKQGLIRGNIGIIIDEIHNFRSISSLRSERALEIAKVTKCEDICCLSGTPIKAMATEAMTLLTLLDPMFRDPVPAIFKSAFGSTSTALSRVVAHRLGLIMHKVNTEDVLSLPTLTEQTLKVKLPNGKEYTLANMSTLIKKYIKERTAYYDKNKHLYEKDYLEALEYFKKHGTYDKKEFDEYQKLVKAIKANRFSSNDERIDFMKRANQYEKKVIYPVLPSEMKKKFMKAKSVVKYVNMVLMGEVIGRLIPEYRVKCYNELVLKANLPELISSAVKKTIIFTTYNSVIENLDAYLRSKQFKPVLAYQKTSKNYAANIDNFKKDESLNPLITTPMTMATGVTILEANVVVFAPQPFRWTDYRQAYARAYRMGQTDPCFVYTLVLDTGNEPNLSTRISEISDWSKDLFMSIMDTPMDAELLQASVQDSGTEAFFIELMEDIAAGLD